MNKMSGAKRKTSPSEDDKAQSGSSGLGGICLPMLPPAPKVVKPSDEDDILVLVKYEDVIVPVHKSNLISKSKVFETVFSGRWEERNSVLTNGKEKVVYYNLLIQDVQCAAVKYLFAQLENECHDSLIEHYDFTLLYDILRIIDFYDMNQSLFDKYKNVMKNYKAESVNQHIDVFEVVEKMRMKNCFGGRANFNNLSEKSLQFIRKKLKDGKMEVRRESKMQMVIDDDDEMEMERMCFPFEERFNQYVPYQNFKILADIISENKHRVDVVDSLFKKLFD